jgi:MoaA/NifB/PqqE/SkfB family radical SAM enzyme
MQILMTSEGKFRPCSKHVDHISHKGKVLNTKTATLETAWHSDYMEEMRKQFLENKQFPGCGECWRQQNMGLRSMRYDSYQYNVPETQVNNPITPLRVELNSSNVCNLKCRICYPTASSKWINEAKKLYGWKERIHENLKNENFEIVKSWAKNLEELCFFGGEPLMSIDNIEFLKFLIKVGLSKDISLLFNTNGTVFSDEIEDILRSFKRTRMYFSIDDIEERFEYQRKGAEWAEVVQNIERAYQFSNSLTDRRVEFKICCTVSSMNIFYMPEFFSFFDKNFPSLKIFWNFIFDPWELSIQLLPKEIKKIITNRLNTNIQPSFEMTEDDTRTIEELTTFLNHDIDMPFDGFFEYVNRHDVYRKESFPNVFFEFWQHIKSFKPDNIDMGIYSTDDEKQMSIINNTSKNIKIEAFELLRYEWESYKLKNSDNNYADALRIISDALNELDKILSGNQKANNNVETMMKLIENKKVGPDSILEDIFVFGIYKFYKSLSEFNEDEATKLLMRKYPSSSLLNFM